MSKQAQVGIFTILGLLLLFGMFYVITDFGTRHTGYRLGVHFATASGLPTGALVYFSGVTVGSVDSIELLPDNTVDVILAVNRDVEIPRASKFLIQTPLTGSPALLIVPPKPGRMAGQPEALETSAEPMWPRHVLPIASQPVGRSNATAADLMEEGQGEIRRLDAMLADLQEREPVLLQSLQQTLDNANHVSATVDTAAGQLAVQSKQIADALSISLNQASSNVLQMTGTLNSTVGRNSKHVDQLVSSLNSTAIALNQSVDALRGLATNRRLKKNIADTTQNIADLTQAMASLTQDLRTVTGNPQTQAQMRDSVAQLDAATQKANSLLETLGGRSHVYGVDAGATPAPGGLAPVPEAAPSGSPPRQPNTAAIRGGLAKIVQRLYAIQVRLSAVDRQRVTGSDPLLSADRGPESDVNLVLLPHGGTSVILGANDIGYHTTANFAAVRHVGGGLAFGGGILYSQLGVLGEYGVGRFGIEGRAYDLRRPTLDLYGNVKVTHWAKFFLGQRDITHADRRTVFGLQLQF